VSPVNRKNQRDAEKMSGLPGIREEPVDRWRFGEPEELQAESESEPPFWPRHLLVGAAIFAAVVALAVVAI
jgi:hypothetical protein